MRQANIAAGFHILVDGQRLAAIQTLDVIDPATGDILAKVPDVDRRDLDAAVGTQPRLFRAGAGRPEMCARPRLAV